MLRLSQQLNIEQRSVFHRVVLIQQQLIFQQKQHVDSLIWLEFSSLLKECSIVLKKHRNDLSR